MASDRVTAFVAALLAIGITTGVDAAPQAAAFEVASVKPKRSGELGSQMRPAPDGSLVAVNSPLPALIEFAYGHPANRIVGLPDWAYQERFDIAARGGGGQPPSMDRIAQMVRSLLAERFGLKTRLEPRQVPVYELQLDRADRRLGPALTVTTRADREAMARGGREAFNQRREPAGSPCGVSNGPGLISARGVAVGAWRVCPSLFPCRWSFQMTPRPQRS